MNMEMTKLDKGDNTQILIQAGNYNVTVIPVEFNRGGTYNNQNSKYISGHSAVQYSHRTQDDYSQTDDIPPSQGGLYSVSQRLPPVNSSYSTLCSGNNTCATDKVTFSKIHPEWDHQQPGPSSARPSLEGNYKTQDDKQTANNDMVGAASLPSTSASTNSNALPSSVIPICVYLHNHTAIMMDIDDTPSATCDLIFHAIVNSEELGLNKHLAAQVFSLWMVSPLLELQLKPTQKPYLIRQLWKSLVEQYCQETEAEAERDEPKIMFQRNVFYPLHSEEKIKDQKILELLYEESRHNIIKGRYPCEVMHYIMLGGIQARIELGPFNIQVHSTHYFREEQSKYLPAHVRKSSTWAWLPISSKSSAEVKLLEQFKRIPNSATNKKLMKKYLEFCWSLPFYGSAFFEGQIEQPVRGLTSLINHQDIPILVAINSRCVYIIDDTECTVLLGMRYEEFNWDYSGPSKEDDPDCLPCIFLQFLVVENGLRVSKMLQVFSKQAKLIDKLISIFVTDTNNRLREEADNGGFENQVNDNEPRPVGTGSTHTANLPSLSNKLSRLTLATFDEDGHCIGRMGSWSAIY